MKLYTSPLSPFARKCQILAQAKNLNVELIIASSEGENGYGSHINPMGKIPILVRENLDPIYDSLVICEYLDGLAAPWLASDGEERWSALRLHRKGDGLSEAVYNLRYETVRDAELHWGKMIKRHETAIVTIIKALETDVLRFSPEWDFANISVVCALDYLDFRAEHLNWREYGPRLSKWHAEFQTDPIWKATNGYL